VKMTDSTSNAQRPTPKAFASELLNPVKGRGPNGALRPQPSVELHIEELVLDGFAPGDRYVIGEAVQRELALLFGEQGVPSLLRSDNATDEIRGATFNAAHNAKPRAIARQIAQAVYQGFSQ
jgi:hypothetical protein